MSRGEFGEGEKALNLVKVLAEKLTIEIRICRLEVGGLTILINFSGLDFQIRVSVCLVIPLHILMVPTHFLVLNMCSRV